MIVVYFCYLHRAISIFSAVDKLATIIRAGYRLSYAQNSADLILYLLKKSGIDEVGADQHIAEAPNSSV